MATQHIRREHGRINLNQVPGGPNDEMKMEKKKKVKEA
jgi:hypothetical protein